MDSPLLNVRRLRGASEEVHQEGSQAARAGVGLMLCKHLRLTIFGTREDGLTRYRCDNCGKQIAQRGQVPDWAYRRTA